jgi:hypothetical protein
VGSHPSRLGVSRGRQVSLRQRLTVNANLSPAHLNGVGRQSHDTFDQQFAPLPVADHHDVAPMIIAEQRQPTVNQAAIPGLQGRRHALALNHNGRQHKLMKQQERDGGPEQRAEEDVTRPSLRLDLTRTKPSASDTSRFRALEFHTAFTSSTVFDLRASAAIHLIQCVVCNFDATPPDEVIRVLSARIAPQIGRLLDSIVQAALELHCRCVPPARPNDRRFAS